MMKFALMACSMYLINNPEMINVGSLSQLRDYGMALLIALLVQPWVVEQFDS